MVISQTIRSIGSQRMIFYNPWINKISKKDISQPLEQRNLKEWHFATLGSSGQLISPKSWDKDLVLISQYQLQISRAYLGLISPFRKSGYEMYHLANATMFKQQYFFLHIRMKFTTQVFKIFHVIREMTLWPKLHMCPLFPLQWTVMGTRSILNPIIFVLLLVCHDHHSWD